MAIGSPLGLPTASPTWIVSALGRNVSKPGGNTLPNDPGGGPEKALDVRLGTYPSGG